MTIPNAISVLRICSTPLICFMISQEYYGLSALLFATAGFSDMVDGVIARNVPNQQSKLGAIIDPLADKILINAVCLTLTYNHLIPVYVTFFIFLRDFGIMGYIFYLKYIQFQQTKMNVKWAGRTNPKIKFTPTYLSKCNTALQLTTVCASLMSPLLHFDVSHPLMQTLFFATAGTTIWSGIQYYQLRKTFIQ